MESGLSGLDEDALLREAMRLSQKSFEEEEAKRKLREEHEQVMRNLSQIDSHTDTKKKKKSDEVEVAPSIPIPITTATKPAIVSATDKRKTEEKDKLQQSLASLSLKAQTVVAPAPVIAAPPKATPAPTLAPSVAAPIKKAAILNPLDESWPWKSESVSAAHYLRTSQWSTERSAHGVGSGLRNLGNSCFLNSTLQCLSYIPLFSQLLCARIHRRMNCESKNTKDRFCALCCTEEVCSLLLTHKPTQVVKPMGLFRNIASVNSLLSSGCQEDAHEYLQSLMDKMEIAYDRSMECYFNNHNLQQQQQKEKKVDVNLYEFSNPIKSLFRGELKTEIMCGGCLKSTTTTEAWYALSLDVDVDSITESLCKFSNEEMLTGDNKYYCESCRKKKLARRKTMLSHCPPILCIQLKRFRVVQDGLTLKMAKDSSAVDFDLSLDLSKFCSSDDSGSESLSSSSELSLLNYDLCGLIVHSGPSLGYGHYYAIIRAPNGDWYRMNDAEVIPIKAKQVLSEQAYILFYQRRNHRETWVKSVCDSFDHAEEMGLIPSVLPLKRSSSDSSSLISSINQDESADVGSDVGTARVVLTDDYFAKGACDDGTSPDSPVLVSHPISK